VVTGNAGKYTLGGRVAGYKIQDAGYRVHPEPCILYPASCIFPPDKPNFVL